MANDPRDKLTGWYNAMPAGLQHYVWHDDAPAGIRCETVADATWLASRLNLAAQLEADRDREMVKVYAEAADGLVREMALEDRIATLEAERDELGRQVEQHSRWAADAERERDTIRRQSHSYADENDRLRDMVAASARERDTAIAAQSRAVESAEAARVDAERLERAGGRMRAALEEIASGRATYRAVEVARGGLCWIEDANGRRVLQQEGASHAD